MLSTETLPAAGMVYTLLNELSADLAVMERPDSQSQVDHSGDESGDDAEGEYDSTVCAKLKRCT